MAILKGYVEVVITTKKNSRKKAYYIVLARYVDTKEAIKKTEFHTPFQFLAITHFKKLVKQFKIYL